MRAAGRFLAVFATSLRERYRNGVLVGLLVVVPVVFVTGAVASSPSGTVPVYTLVEGRETTVVRTMPDVHAAVMTPLAGAFITGLTGLFVIHSASGVDGRLVRCGYRPAEVVTARFVTIVVAAAVATGTATGVMWLNFEPTNPGWFVLGVFLVSIIYGFVGLLVGVVADRTPGMYVLLFAPLMDVGVFQDPMLYRGPAEPWMTVLPGYFPLRIVLDAAFTSSVGTGESLGLAVAYLGVLLVVTAVAFAWQTRLQ